MCCCECYESRFTVHIICITHHSHSLSFMTVVKEKRHLDWRAVQSLWGHRKAQDKARLPSLRARPKSMSLILLPVLLTHIMFSGFRSKWTMPCLWMKLTPATICSMYLITSLSDSSKSSSMIRSKSSPPEILQATLVFSYGHKLTIPKYNCSCRRPAEGD